MKSWQRKLAQRINSFLGGPTLSGGGGVFYGIGEGNAGQLFTSDYSTLSGRPWLEKSPAINACASIISRLFQSVPLQLQRPSGEVVKEHPVLDLFNRAPNEYQTPGVVIEALAKELVYCGEAILRVDRDGTVPRRLYILPAEAVTLNDGVSSAYSGGYQGPPTYNYAAESFVLNPSLPQVMHLRRNVDPYYPLRGRPAVCGMDAEIFASIYASLYHREVFRQGGPPRLALETEERTGDVTEKETIAALASFTQTVKSSQSWTRTPALPSGWKVKDLGATGRDMMLTMAARLIDEKLSAAYGVPIIYLNNLERATYANARQMLAILVKDALRPLLTEMQQCIQRDLLMPMGGVNAKFKAILDPEVLLRDEARVFNEIILARYDKRVITQAEAREAFGYDPKSGPEEKPEGGVEPKPTNGEDEDAPTPDPDDLEDIGPGAP